jgi:hypothetical protein
MAGVIWSDPFRGRASYFGELLSQRLLVTGHDVQTLDLHASDLVGAHAVQGDVWVVVQVPLAKDKSLFWPVNREGTRVLLDATLRC